MSNDFETYWLIHGVKHTGRHTVEQKVAAGAIAVEVSAARQQAEAQRRRQQAIQNAIADAKIREAALRREHENSAQGEREAAVRSAAENPGGIVTFCGPTGGFEELDAFGPAKTNLLR